MQHSGFATEPQGIVTVIFCHDDVSGLSQRLGDRSALTCGPDDQENTFSQLRRSLSAGSKDQIWCCCPRVHCPLRFPFPPLGGFVPGLFLSLFLRAIGAPPLSHIYSVCHPGHRPLQGRRVAAERVDFAGSPAAPRRMPSACVRNRHNDGCASLGSFRSVRTSTPDQPRTVGTVVPKVRGCTQTDQLAAWKAERR
jgi:hypothetical protein